jgi:hypothetical protein
MEWIRIRDTMYDKTLDFHATWSLPVPELAEITFTGRLTFDYKKGGLLSLDNSGTDFPDAVGRHMVQHDGFTLVGRPDDGSWNVVSCVGCQASPPSIKTIIQNASGETVASPAFPPFFNIEVRVRWIIPGANLVTLGDATVAGVRMKMSQLPRWIGQPDLTITPTEDTFEYRIHRKHKSVDVAVKENMSLRLFSYWVISNKREPIRNFEFHAAAHVDLHSNEPGAFYDLFRVGYTFNDFLTFAMNEPSTVTSVGLIMDDRSIRDVLFQPARHELPISKTIPETAIPISEVWDVASLVRQWIQEYDSVRTPMVFYFASEYHAESSFIDQRFFNLMQSFEAFHRRYYRDSQFLPTEQFDQEIKNELVAAIPSQVDDDFRQRIQSAVGQLNQFSLKKRIVEYLLAREDLLSEFVNKAACPAEANLYDYSATVYTVARNMTQARNDMAHANEGVWDRSNACFYDYATLLKKMIQQMIVEHVLHPPAAIPEDS